MKPATRLSTIWLLSLIMLGTAPLAHSQQQEETFSEITPGDPSADPANLIGRALRGDVRAMNNIGLLWAKGVGVDRPNFDEALRWWKEAAKHGYPLAMNNIGLLYVNGQGVPRDARKALAWYGRAADRGIAYAMHGIGQLTQAGQGTPADLPEAYAWYTVAADYYISADTDDIALNARARESLAKQLSADELERSRLLTASLKERIEQRRRPAPLKPGERAT